MKKVFRKLHLWLSIPFGLIITIICFTGAALVFENELMEIFYRDRYYVENADKNPVAIDKLLDSVSAQLPDSVSVSSVNISSDPQKAYQLSLSKPRRASVYVDQYTGEIKWYYKRGEFFTFMFKMHRWLLDTTEHGKISVGKTIVGISTLLFVVVLISGIVIWIPRTRKAFKNSLKISVKKGLKRFWYDLHVAGGIYAVVILLALALTGLTWSFSWYRSGFYKVFGVETQQQQAPPAPPAQNADNQQKVPQHEATASADNLKQPSNNNHSDQHEARSGENNRNFDKHQNANNQADSTNTVRRGRRENTAKTSQFAQWQNIFVELITQNPNYKQISISKNSANVSFNRWGNQRATDKYSFDPESGEIKEIIYYKNLDKSGKIRGWIYSVHVGNWGGLFSKIITFLAALLGATLPLTGYYLWIKKYNSKRRARKNKRKS